MNKLTEQGDAVIMVSSELPEVLGMSDRVLVIHEGKVGGILGKDEASQELKLGDEWLQQLGSLIGLVLIIVVITALNPALKFQIYLIYCVKYRLMRLLHLE